MKLTGEARVRASLIDVFDALTNPSMLVRTLPGCERLEQLDVDSYRTTMTAGVGAIKGSFAGQVRLSDRRSPTALTLHASGVGAPGTVDAVARVTLHDAGDGITLVCYDADATVGGVIGGVGQRMLIGAARRSADEFFLAVGRELANPFVPGGDEVAPAGTVTPVDTVVPVAPAAGVWTRPAPPVDRARQRVQDLLVGVVCGAVIALVGVVVGVLVTR